MKYRETSKIVTLYTRDFGKMSVIVKGARQSKNTFGASLEPMSYVHAVVYRKEERELQTLSQCDVVHSLRALTEDLEKMSAGMTIIELVSVIAHEEEKNITLFNLLIATLTALNDAKANPAFHLYFFEIHLARILGFQPVFDRCISCGRSVSKQLSPDDEIPFHLGRGGPLCGHCPKGGGQTVLISRSNLLMLEKIASCEDCSDIQNFTKTAQFNANANAVMGNFLWEYLRHHVSGVRPLRSTKVFSKILTAM